VKTPLEIRTAILAAIPDLIGIRYFGDIVQPSILMLPDPAHVVALQDNIIREGGDPDTGAAWKTLSAKYIAHKRLIGAFLTILRRTDAMGL
jgi:hypothetical protein